MRRIDSHHHVWQLDRHPQSWMTPEQDAVIGRDFDVHDWAAQARPAGVDAAVLVQTVADPTETTEFLALAASTPWLVGVVGWVNVDAGPAAVRERIAGLREQPGAEHLVGLRDQSVYRDGPAWLVEEAASAYHSACGAAGLVVDLLVRPDQVAAAAQAVREHPGTRFVLDHLGNPDFDTTTAREWGEQLADLAACPNVALKLSAVAARAHDPATVRELLPSWVATAVELFGAERVMFGSDWPVSSMSMTYADVVAVVENSLEPLGPLAGQKIWADTATEWYGLRV